MSPVCMAASWIGSRYPSSTLPMRSQPPSITLAACWSATLSARKSRLTRKISPIRIALTVWCATLRAGSQQRSAAPNWKTLTTVASFAPWVASRPTPQSRRCGPSRNIGGRRATGTGAMVTQFLRQWRRICPAPSMANGRSVALRGSRARLTQPIFRAGVACHTGALTARWSISACWAAFARKKGSGKRPGPAFPPSVRISLVTRGDGWTHSAALQVHARPSTSALTPCTYSGKGSIGCAASAVLALGAWGTCA